MEREGWEEHRKRVRESKEARNGKDESIFGIYSIQTIFNYAIVDLCLTCIKSEIRFKRKVE